MTELEKLLRMQQLDNRNSGEEAKHLLMRQAADRIAKLEQLLDEVYEHGENMSLHIRIGEALGKAD